MPITSGPDPLLATNAVGRSATPRSTEKPAGGELFGAPPRCLLLLEGELGMGVDAVRERDEFLGGVGDAAGCAAAFASRLVSLTG